MLQDRQTFSLRSFLFLFVPFTVFIGATLLLWINIASAQEEDALVIMAPKQQQWRLLEDLASGYREETGRDVKLWQPNRRGKPWDRATQLLDKGHNGTHMMLTSRLDWQYRAGREDRKSFTYLPLAKQRVNRGDRLVGGVEYGVIFPENDPSPLVKDFLNFTRGTGRPILTQPDPHHFIPADAHVPEYQPTEFNRKKAWKGKKPMIWHGVAHMGYRRLHTTVIAEMKKVWMQGFNLIQGGTINTEPVLQFAEEHGMLVMGYPDVNEKKSNTNPDEHPMLDRVRLARKYPSTRFIYEENEDHMTWVFVPLYMNKYRMHNGEDMSSPVGERKSVEEYFREHSDDKLSEEQVKLRVEEVRTAERQFRDWLKKKHNSLETLNKRWDTDHENWASIGLPQLPVDRVKRISEETGFEVNRKRGSWYHTWLLKMFRDPLRFHLYEWDPALLDLCRFLRTAWARRYKALEEPRNGNQVLWNTNFTNHAKDLQPLLEPRKGEDVPGFIYTTKSRPDVFLFREVPEFNAMSYDHPACKMPPFYTQIPGDVQQIAKDKPTWNSEHHLYNHDKSTPRRVRYHLLQTFLAGQFKSSSYNRIRTTESSRRERHISATRTRAQISEAEEALRALLKARSGADISVLVTEGNRAWNMFPDHPARPELGGAVRAYAHVGALGKNWKYVINEDVSDKHVTGKLIVDSPWLERSTLEKINNLSENRELIVIGELPTSDEYGQPLPEDDVSQFRERATVIDGWESLQDKIQPAEGLPEIYRKTTKAEYYWWTPVHGRDGYMIPVPKLEARRAKVGNKTYVAVLNHSHYSRRNAPIPWAEGKAVHEYTAHDSASRDVHVGEHVYGENETTLFETESVKIYKLTPAE